MDVRAKDIQMKYIPHIDGLRAIAVLSVLFFHLDFDWLPGGYVGVDIFFVISGFLITKLILDQSLKGSFTFSNFYLRRARRILPALYFTILLSSFLGFLTFSSKHFEHFGAELLFSVASSSNIFFWTESGYFDSDSLLKPLLHTWSLGVEEQFYLFWPILVTAIMLCTNRKGLLVVTATLFLISFYLNYLSISANLDDIIDVSASFVPSFNSPSAIFYLLPFRIFEFCIGASLIFLTDLKPKKYMDEVLLFIGLTLITYSFLVYNKTTVFPWINALLPCLGAAFCIFAGKARYLGQMLRNKLMVNIGLISYSLYLVHWPLIVFYRYYKFQPLTIFEKVSIIFLAILLSIFCYRFIEKTFRSPNPNTDTSFLLILVLSTIVFSTFGAVIWKFEGLSWRINKLETPHIVQTWATPKLATNKISKNLKAISPGHKSNVIRANKENANSKKVLIIGDSHAGRTYGLAGYLAYKYGYDVYLHWKPAFLPVKGLKHVNRKRINKIPKSITSMIKIRPMEYWKAIKKHKFDYIVINARWSFYFNDNYSGISRSSRVLTKESKTLDQQESYQVFTDALPKSTDFFLELAPKIVYLMQPPPPLGRMAGCDNVPDYLFKNASERCLGLAPPFEVAEKRMKPVENIFNDHTENLQNVWTINTFDKFCPRNQTHCIAYLNGNPLFTDDNHLHRQFGNAFLVDKSKVELERIFGGQK